jgi:hypothetical protein
MKICLRQWIRPRGPYVKIEGVGDCNICKPHKDNLNCKLYYPINISTFTVKEREDALHKKRK